MQTNVYLANVYLDNAATTQLDPEVLAAMLPFMQDPILQANSAAQHQMGDIAAQAIAHARSQVAALINASPEEIVFTSGATEANHLAICGGAKFYQQRGKHLVISAIEHASGLAAAEQLSKQDFVVSTIPVQKNGMVVVDEVMQQVRPDTTLLSLMLVNNETGVLQPVAELGQALAAHSLKLHCDAVAAVGKVAVDVQALAVDYLSLTAHKIYGPKGIGALYIRNTPKARVIPLFGGGHHEFGVRAGTLPTAQIVGFGAACAKAQQQMQTDAKKIIAMRDDLWQRLQGLGDIYLHGDVEDAKRVPHILHFAVAHIDGEALLQSLPDLAISMGSACHAQSRLPSHVLSAMHVPTHLAHSSLRISLGRFTTEQEIAYAANRLAEEITRLRAIAPCTEKGGMDDKF